MRRRARAALPLLPVLLGGCGFSVAAVSGGDDGMIDADPSACAPSGWRDPAWASRYPLVVQHAQVTGTPGGLGVLVAITSAELERARPDGADLMFTGGDGTSVVPYEIERFDQATGALLAWVGLVGLNAGADTRFYLYFDNPAATPTSSGDVWPDYLAVWHFREDPGAAVPVRDSTSHGNDLTTQGMTAADRVAGKVGSGFHFDGTNNGLTRTPFNLPARFTYEAWVRPDQLSGYHTVFNNTSDNRWFGFSNDDLDFYDGSSDHVAPATTSLNAWHHIAATYDGAQVRTYFDGLPVGNPMAVALAASTAPFRVGFDNVGEWFSGTIDEMRIDSVDRSADAIATSYASEHAPDQFVIPGTIERCR